MSVAVILASSSSSLRVMAMQPEPVPQSRILGFLGRTGFFGLTLGRKGTPARLRTASMSCSVSGRGVRTWSSTKKSRP